MLSKYLPRDVLQYVVHPYCESYTVVTVSTTATAEYKSHIVRVVPLYLERVSLPAGCICRESVINASYTMVKSMYRGLPVRKYLYSRNTQSIFEVRNYDDKGRLHGAVYEYGKNTYMMCTWLHGVRDGICIQSGHFCIENKPMYLVHSSMSGYGVHVYDHNLVVSSTYYTDSTFTRRSCSYVVPRKSNALQYTVYNDDNTVHMTYNYRYQYDSDELFRARWGIIDRRQKHWNLHGTVNTYTDGVITHRAVYDRGVLQV